MVGLVVRRTQEIVRTDHPTPGDIVSNPRRTESGNRSMTETDGLNLLSNPTSTRSGVEEGAFRKGKPKRPLNAQRRKAPRGPLCVLIAATTVTFLIFAGLTLDVGYVCAWTSAQQNAADVGALIGAGALRDGNLHGILHRIRRTIHHGDDRAMASQPRDVKIEFGAWDDERQTFSPLEANEWTRRAFAVRVRVGSREAPFFLSGLTGRPQPTVWREAVAVGAKPCFGVWGVEALNIHGELFVDAFRSPSGPYVENENLGGDVCSGGDIFAKGACEIHGNVMAGIKSAANISIDAASVSGMTASALSRPFFKEIDFDSMETKNDNASVPTTDRGRRPFSADGHFWLEADDALTLPAGDYFFDSLTLRRGSSLAVVGPTRILVRGDVRIEGNGLVDGSQRTALPVIISNGKSVTLSGRLSFYGSIFAPQAEVRLEGGVEYFGALVGGTVTVWDRVRFHVDEASPLAERLLPQQPRLMR